MVRELNSCGSIFRVLALSATPGNDLKVCTYCGHSVSCVNPSLPPVPPQAVQQVVSNLQLSHIELRAEDSIDIQPYTHRRKVELNVVPLEGEILLVKTAFLKVLSGIIGKLAKHGVVYSANPERLSKFALLQARDGFRQRPPPSGVHVSHYTLYIMITHSLCPLSPPAWKYRVRLCDGHQPLPRLRPTHTAWHALLPPVPRPHIHWILLPHKDRDRSSPRAVSTHGRIASKTN